MAPSIEDADPPREVQVTLLPNPDRHPLLERVRLPPVVRAGVKLLIGLLAAGVAVFVATSLPGDRVAPHAPAPAASARKQPAASARKQAAASARKQAAAARRPGAEGVAAAYGYPLACLSVTIDAADPAYARADFNHGSACGRYDGDVTAIFHRVDHAWRPVLDATGYPCPTPSLSTAVQTALDVCP